MRPADSEMVSSVLSFLESIYNSMAETLPDVRDTLQDVFPDCSDSDPYLAAMDFDGPVEKPPKGKKMRRGVQVAPGRTVQEGCELRFLPPGTMKEFWVQYCQGCPTTARKASFPTFWRLWASHYSFMRFRTTSSHAQCALRVLR